jgi:hypothetical protein
MRLSVCKLDFANCFALEFFGGQGRERRFGTRAVVDLRSGQSIALLELQTAVEEIFDVQLLPGLPGLHFPEVIGFQKDSLHHTFIIPHKQKSLSQP